jgi:hypothetical protein
MVLSLAIGQNGGGRRPPPKKAAGGLLRVATIATVAFRRSDVFFEDIDPGHIYGLDHELLVLIVVHLFSPPFVLECASTASRGRKAKTCQPG